MDSMAVNKWKRYMKRFQEEKFAPVEDEYWRANNTSDYPKLYGGTGNPKYSARLGELQKRLQQLRAYQKYMGTAQREAWSGGKAPPNFKYNPNLSWEQFYDQYLL